MAGWRCSGGCRWDFDGAEAVGVIGGGFCGGFSGIAFFSVVLLLAVVLVAAFRRLH
jgi:hypothetical protein